MKSIYIYIDGACSGNPGPGGWGALLVYESCEKVLCGGDKETTNNRMELMAAIQALSAIKPNKLKGEEHRIYITTDSRYLKDGIEKWLANWKRNNWRTSKKKTVKNQDLWMQLEQLNSRFRVKWKWVRSHSGHRENERVDKIARDSIPHQNLYNNPL